jgi:hypothetical protein
MQEPHKPTAIEQALGEDRSANPARPGTEVTSRPFLSNAWVTLKSADSNPLARTQAAKALDEAAVVNFMVPMCSSAEDAE